MMDVESVVINNKTYIEVDQVDINGVTYAYLSNFLNDKDFCIRKLVPKDGKVYYGGQKDEEEFQLALMHFAKKHKDLLKEIEE